MTGVNVVSELYTYTYTYEFEGLIAVKWRHDSWHSKYIIAHVGHVPSHSHAGGQGNGGCGFQEGKFRLSSCRGVTSEVATSHASNSASIADFKLA